MTSTHGIPTGLAVMEKYLVLAGLLIASALVVPGILEDRISQEQAATATNPAARPARQEVVMPARAEPSNARNSNPLDGRRTIIEADSRGHFVTEARMNGSRQEVLVDTGATLVAMNESTARELGIRLSASDFKYRVSTANGDTEAALVTIDRIEIDRLRAEDVQATVTRDEALDIVLLGMSFLNKLKRFQIENGELVLTQ